VPVVRLLDASHAAPSQSQSVGQVIGPGVMATRRLRSKVGVALDVHELPVLVSLLMVHALHEGLQEH